MAPKRLKGGLAGWGVQDVNAAEFTEAAQVFEGTAEISLPNSQSPFSGLRCVNVLGDV